MPAETEQEANPMKSESADELHRRFNKRAVYLVLVIVGFFIVSNWNELLRFVDDPTTPEGMRWILVRLSISGILLLLLLTIGGSALRIMFKAKRNAQTSSAFHDEFHDQIEKKAVLFSWYSTMVALLVLTAVALVSTVSLPKLALSAALTAQIAMVVSVVTLIGSLLFYDRQQ